MKESEIRLLFLKISNSYNSFVYDDFKVNHWMNLLQEVPFKRAEENLRRYTLNPENTFPPHPGALAESVAERSAGPHVLNAGDTRLMLEQIEAERQGASVRIPEHIKERVKYLGLSSSSRADV